MFFEKDGRVFLKKQPNVFSRKNIGTMLTNKLSYAVGLLLLLAACDLIDYHPYDGRLSADTETDINRKNIERIESGTQGKDTLRFILMGDSQRCLDETEDFVTAVNKRKDVDFVIHGGDMADFGLKKEYEWTHEIMSKLTVPYVALIGNHDIIGNGDRVYLKMYGDENFSFIAGDTKFLCLNTNAIEFDYSHPVPDFSYIKKELQDTSAHKQTIVAMHAPPGSDQFNNNVADAFEGYILKFPRLLFCLHAHNHNVSAEDIFHDGILYYGCSNMKKRTYLYFTVTPETYTYEIVTY